MTQGFADLQAPSLELDAGAAQTLAILRGLDADLPSLTVGSKTIGNDFAADFNEIIPNTLIRKQLSHSIDAMPFGDCRKIDSQAWNGFLDGGWIESDS